MFPLRLTLAALILMWNPAPILAADEPPGLGSVEAGSETRAQPIRDAETAGFGLDDSERANDTGQARDSTHQPGPSESRAKPSPLGLCDGS